jgi:hypothetical protein
MAKSLVVLSLLLSVSCNGIVAPDATRPSASPAIEANCSAGNYYESLFPRDLCLVFRGKFYVSIMDLGQCVLSRRTYSCAAFQSSVYVQGEFTAEPLPVVEGMCNLCDGKMAIYSAMDAL